MWIHKYRLQPATSLSSRSSKESRLGFFIRILDPLKTDDPIKQFLNYSDFTHWPELGDPALADLKNTLMKTANADFQFPFSINEKDLVPVKSNALIFRYDKSLGQEMELIQDGKFEVLKFKMGRNFKDEYAALMKLNLKPYLVRIDFNNSLNFKEAKEALEMLKKVPSLEYIEDPTQYEDYYWAELEKITPIALDNFATTPVQPKHFQFRILKPLRGIPMSQIRQWTIEKKKIVLTNMMDNLVGAWKTYFYYCELKKQFPYHVITPGFHTHTLFSNYEYAALLGFKGAEWSYDQTKLEKVLATLEQLYWLQISFLDHKNLEQIVKELEAKP